jgi:hypothetical protein
MQFYSYLLTDIKTRIQGAQVRALLAVNAELLRLYWEIGQVLHTRQQEKGWGAGVIPKLAIDLHNELPELKGFSERNLKRMLGFYRAYPQPEQFVPQAVAQTHDLKIPQLAARCWSGFATPTEMFEDFNGFQNVSDGVANPVTLCWAMNFNVKQRIPMEVKPCCI